MRTMRQTRRSLLAGTALTGALAIAVAFPGSPARGQALPTGGSVVGGAATIQSGAGRVDVHQTSPDAIIEWQDFSIGQGGTVRFHQPDASSIALNRVVGGIESQIHGALQANGQVWLVNPAGIFFGPTATIDVSGLLATTHDIRNEDFLAGNHVFRPVEGATGIVVNEGSVTVADAGLAALVAPAVANRGVISARLGRVTLAAGGAFDVVDLFGDARINLAVPQGAVSARPVGRDGRPVDVLVEQSGAVYADGGRVLIAASTASAIVDRVVDVSGIVRARTVTRHADGTVEFLGGDVRIEAAGPGRVEVSGTVDATGAEAGQRGGDVVVAGEVVAVLDGASVDASGEAGGGRVFVGGEYLGGRATAEQKARYGISDPDRDVRNADVTYVAATATIRADATGAGDGGQVIVWSDDTTRTHGTITARGGVSGGDGGFVETSGARRLTVTRAADASARAAGGLRGIWLLDPTDVVIVAGSAETGGTFSANVFAPAASGPSTIGADLVVDALRAGSDVVIQTASAGGDAGNITVNAELFVDFSANASSDDNAILTLNAANSVIFAPGSSIEVVGGALTIDAQSAAGGAPTAVYSAGGWLQAGAGGTLTLHATGFGHLDVDGLVRAMDGGQVALDLWNFTSADIGAGARFEAVSGGAVHGSIGAHYGSLVVADGAQFNASGGGALGGMYYFSLIGQDVVFDGDVNIVSGGTADFDMYASLGPLTVGAPASFNVVGPGSEASFLLNGQTTTFAGNVSASGMAEMAFTLQGNGAVVFSSTSGVSATSEATGYFDASSTTGTLLFDGLFAVSLGSDLSFNLDSATTTTFGAGATIAVTGLSRSYVSLSSSSTLNFLGSAQVSASNATIAAVSPYFSFGSSASVAFTDGAVGAFGASSGDANFYLYGDVVVSGSSPRIDLSAGNGTLHLGDTFSAVFDAASDGMLVLSAAQNITTSNNSYISMPGGDLELRIGQTNGTLSGINLPAAQFSGREITVGTYGFTSSIWVGSEASNASAYGLLLAQADLDKLDGFGIVTIGQSDSQNGTISIGTVDLSRPTGFFAAGEYGLVRLADGASITATAVEPDSGLSVAFVGGGNDSFGGFSQGNGATVSAAGGVGLGGWNLDFDTAAPTSIDGTFVAFIGADYRKGPQPEASYGYPPLVFVGDELPPDPPEGRGATRVGQAALDWAYAAGFPLVVIGEPGSGSHDYVGIYFAGAIDFRQQTLVSAPGYGSYIYIDGAQIGSTGTGTITIASGSALTIWDSTIDVGAAPLQLVANTFYVEDFFGPVSIASDAGITVATYDLRPMFVLGFDHEDLLEASPLFDLFYYGQSTSLSPTLFSALATPRLTLDAGSIHAFGTLPSPFADFRLSAAGDITLDGSFFGQDLTILGAHDVDLTGDIVLSGSFRQFSGSGTTTVTGLLSTGGVSFVSTGALFGGTFDVAGLDADVVFGDIFGSFAPEGVRLLEPGGLLFVNGVPLGSGDLVDDDDLDDEFLAAQDALDDIDGLLAQLGQDVEAGGGADAFLADLLSSLLDLSDDGGGDGPAINPFAATTIPGAADLFSAEFGQALGEVADALRSGGVAGALSAMTGELGLNNVQIRAVLAALPFDQIVASLGDSDAPGARAFAGAAQGILSGAVGFGDFRALLEQQGVAPEEARGFLALFQRAQREARNQAYAGALGDIQSNLGASGLPGPGDRPPPQMETVSVQPVVGTGSVSTSGRIDLGGQLATLRVNGRWVFVDDDGSFDARVPAGPDGRVEFTIVDESGRTVSADRQLSAAQLAQLAPEPDPLPPGRRVALLFAVEQYIDDSVSDLGTPSEDATLIDGVLRQRLGFETRVYRDPTRSEIFDAIRDVARELTEDDQLVVYYAGHGYSFYGTDLAYWLPADAETTRANAWISSAELSRLFHRIPARQILMIADSCYSGGFAGDAVEQVDDVPLAELAQRRAVMAMTSGGDEPVADGAENSPFARALADELGRLDRAQPLSVAFEPVRSRVEQEMPQTPNYGIVRFAGFDDGADFVVAPRRQQVSEMRTR
jgi:filamentous hemagglutinin family protein